MALVLHGTLPIDAIVGELAASVRDFEKEDLAREKRTADILQRCFLEALAFLSAR